jgi:hypothetical protein
MIVAFPVIELFKTTYKPESVYLPGRLRLFLYATDLTQIPYIQSNP